MFSGHFGVLCEPIRVNVDPNVYPKNRVYDIDTNDDRLKPLLPSLHSKNIGDHLITLHQMEIDYCGSDTNIGAVMIGVGDSMVTWTVRTELPLNNRTCADDASCLYSTSSVGSYFELPNMVLSEGMIFICATSEDGSVSREKDIEITHGIAGCSNGFIVDYTAPSSGHVEISSKDGYITTLQHQSVYWYGFHDNSEIFNVGRAINLYQYALGKMNKFLNS